MSKGDRVLHLDTGIIGHIIGFDRALPGERCSWAFVSIEGKPANQAPAMFYVDELEIVGYA